MSKKGGGTVDWMSRHSSMAGRGLQTLFVEGGKDKAFHGSCQAKTKKKRCGVGGAPSNPQPCYRS